MLSINILNLIDDLMYFPILIIVMAAAGLYFTARTRGVQVRLFGESVSFSWNRVMMKTQYPPCRQCLCPLLQG